MKKNTICIGVTFIIVAVFYSQIGSAMPTETKPFMSTKLKATPISVVSNVDDDRQDEDDNDQCELIFPFCEAN